MTDLLLEMIENTYLILFLALVTMIVVFAMILKLVDWIFRREIAKKEQERKNEIL